MRRKCNLTLLVLLTALLLCTSRVVYNRDSAEAAAISAFKDYISSKCSVRKEDVQIHINEIKDIYDDRGRYFAISASVKIENNDRMIFGSVDDTINILGYDFNGTDITGVDIYCK